MEKDMLFGSNVCESVERYVGSRSLFVMHMLKEQHLSNNSLIIIILFRVVREAKCTHTNDHLEVRYSIY